MRSLAIRRASTMARSSPNPSFDALAMRCGMSVSSFLMLSPSSSV
jgi:hypothetical protein